MSFTLSRPVLGMYYVQINDFARSLLSLSLHKEWVYRPGGILVSLCMRMF
jgi:hypothetical protein